MYVEYQIYSIHFFHPIPRPWWLATGGVAVPTAAYFTDAIRHGGRTCLGIVRAARLPGPGGAG